MSSDGRLLELMDRWADAQENGSPLTAEELCQDCPNLLPELQKQIAMLQAMDAHRDGLAGPPAADREMAEPVVAETSFDEIELLAKGRLGDSQRSTAPVA